MTDNLRYDPYDIHLADEGLQIILESPPGIEPRTPSPSGNLLNNYTTQMTVPFSFLCSEMQGIKLGPLGYAPDLEHQATNSIFTDNAFDCPWL